MGGGGVCAHLEWNQESQLPSAPGSVNWLIFWWSVCSSFTKWVNDCCMISPPSVFQELFLSYSYLGNVGYENLYCSLHLWHCISQKAPHKFSTKSYFERRVLSRISSTQLEGGRLSDRLLSPMAGARGSQVCWLNLRLQSQPEFWTCCSSSRDFRQVIQPLGASFLTYETG